MNSGQLLVILGVAFLTAAIIIFFVERKRYGQPKGISKAEFYGLTIGFGAAGVLALIIGAILWYRKSKKGV